VICLWVSIENQTNCSVDDNAMTQAPRPGTSFSRPLSSAGQVGGISQSIRPMSNAGRPMSGFLRPGTNRPMTGSTRGNLTTALAAQRAGTSRPVTSGGRLVRLGTASLMQSAGD